VDVTFLNDPTNEKSDKVEGAIGEFSSFHETFQYYAEGVSTSTAVLAPGWEDRLVVFENESTKPGRGLCLEPHDCVAAKLAAGREKDFEFAAALLREQLVDSDILIARIEALSIRSTQMQRITSWVRARAPKTPGVGS
jgi:hypothetical protein